MKRTFFYSGVQIIVLTMIFLLSSLNNLYAQGQRLAQDSVNIHTKNLSECNDSCIHNEDTTNTRSTTQELYCSYLRVTRNHGNWVGFKTDNNKFWWLHNHYNDGKIRFAFDDFNDNKPVNWHVLVLDGNTANVGIGTSNPTSKLEIKSEGDPDLIEGQMSNGKEHGIQIWGNDQTMLMGVSTPKRVAYIQSTDLWTEASTLALNPSGGSVTIGTLNAAGYRLAVAGSIKAKEIKVTLDGWADFVFDDDYSLISLFDLEKYIQKNKHLPNIPSAEEVKQQDLGLGEMNKRLLQKVEELTLYTIQQQKEINELKKIVKELSKKQ